MLSPALPTLPLATVPAHAIHNPDARRGPTAVQVIRNEYVTDVPVRVLGNVGPDRVQVTGTLRPTDALIAASSVPLQAGTLLRFAGASGRDAVEATTPNPAAVGEAAELTPPRAPGPARQCSGRVEARHEPGRNHSGPQARGRQLRRLTGRSGTPRAES